MRAIQATELRGTSGYQPLELFKFTAPVFNETLITKITKELLQAQRESDYLEFTHKLEQLETLAWTVTKFKLAKGRVAAIGHLFELKDFLTEHDRAYLLEYVANQLDILTQYIAKHTEALNTLFPGYRADLEWPSVKLLREKVNALRSRKGERKVGPTSPSILSSQLDLNTNATRTTAYEEPTELELLTLTANERLVYDRLVELQYPDQIGRDTITNLFKTTAIASIATFQDITRLFDFASGESFSQEQYDAHEQSLEFIRNVATGMCCGQGYSKEKRELAEGAIPCTMGFTVIDWPRLIAKEKKQLELAKFFGPNCLNQEEFEQAIEALTVFEMSLSRLNCNYLQNVLLLHKTSYISKPFINLLLSLNKTHFEEEFLDLQVTFSKLQECIGNYQAWLTDLFKPPRSNSEPTLTKLTLGCASPRTRSPSLPTATDPLESSLVHVSKEKKALYKAKQESLKALQKVSEMHFRKILIARAHYEKKPDPSTAMASIDTLHFSIGALSVKIDEVIKSYNAQQLHILYDTEPNGFLNLWSNKPPKLPLEFEAAPCIDPAIWRSRTARLEKRLTYAEHAVRDGKLHSNKLRR